MDKNSIDIVDYKDIKKLNKSIDQTNKALDRINNPQSTTLGPTPEEFKIFITILILGLIITLIIATFTHQDWFTMVNTPIKHV